MYRMQYFEHLLVGLMLFAAVFYLYRSFLPKKANGSNCGCGTNDCQVAKPRVAPK